MTTSQILDDIYQLKENYHNDNNTFKIKKTVTEEDFTLKMKFFIDNYKKNIKDVRIIDTKNYHDYNSILKIYDNGDMESSIIKKLKYVKYDNVMLELYNQRNIQVNHFNFKQNYDKIFKMKKIIIEDKYEHFIEFIVCMEEKDTKNDNKSKIFNINIITQSDNISNKLENIIELLK